jgi:hypothetical protein
VIEVEEEKGHYYVVVVLGRPGKENGRRPASVLKPTYYWGAAVESILYNSLNMIQWGNREAKAIL